MRNERRTQQDLVAVVNRTTGEVIIGTMVYFYRDGRAYTAAALMPDAVAEHLIKPGLIYTVRVFENTYAEANRAWRELDEDIEAALQACEEVEQSQLVAKLDEILNQLGGADND